MCQLRWEGTLRCAAVGGEANGLRAGSLYGIVHGIYPESKQTKTVSGRGPLQKTGVFISGLPQGFPQKNGIYVIYNMTLFLIYWSYTDGTLASNSRR